MKLVVKKQAWKVYLPKLASVGLFILLGGGAFMSRYRIGIDSQIDRCIPNYSVYLIDLKNQNIEKDKIYAFKANGLQPLFKDGTWMVKYLRAIPGDVVEVDPQMDVKVNDRTLASGLPLIMKIGGTEKSFVGKKKLMDDQYWVMGSSYTSFDSRYWETIKQEQIIGRAYPIF